jgi:hypothetical protein
MEISRLIGVAGVSAALGLFAWAPRTAAQTQPEPEKYDADVFPITFWAFTYLLGDPERYKTAISDEQYKLIKDCNFNMVIGGPLEQARKHGLKCMSGALQEMPGKDFPALWWPPFDAPPPARLLTAMMDAVKAVDKKNPALWGYFLTDEPGRVLFPRVGWYHAIIRTADPNHKIFVNLLPGSDPELYIKETKPDVIAYDHYPIFDGDDSDVTVDNSSQFPDKGTAGFDRTSFLRSLAVFRAASIKHKKLFIPSLLSTGHRYEYVSEGKKYIRDYGRITEGKLRWQAYSALAYKADGIAWFTYFPSKSAEYRPAPIGPDWKPTESYFWLQKLNAEVFSIGKILKTLKSEAVYETKPVYFWKSEGEKDVTFFPADGVVRKVDNALTTVGKFTDGKSNTYLLIVNRNIRKEAEPSLDLTWDRIDLIELYDKDALKWGPVIWKKGGGNNLELKLAPGDGALIKISGAAAPQPKI